MRTQAGAVASHPPLRGWHPCGQGFSTMFCHRPVHFPFICPFFLTFPSPQPHQDLLSFSIFPFSKGMPPFCPVWSPSGQPRHSQEESRLAGNHSVDTLRFYKCEVSPSCVLGPGGKLKRGSESLASSIFPLSFSCLPFPKEPAPSGLAT